MNAKSKMNDFNLLQVLLTLDPRHRQHPHRHLLGRHHVCLTISVCVCVWEYMCVCVRVCAVYLVAVSLLI